MKAAAGAKVKNPYAPISSFQGSSLSQLTDKYNSQITANKKRKDQPASS